MPGVRRIIGSAVALDRADIDTDQIIPATWLKRVGRTGYADGLFEAWRADPGFVLNQPAAAAARILVTGPNFGCGSSREHAVWALAEFGFQAVIAPSFGAIFRGNAVRSGLVPAQADERAVARLLAALAADPAAELVIDVADLVITMPSADLRAPFQLDDDARRRLLDGLDDITLTLRRADSITGYEAARAGWLPALRRPGPRSLSES